MQLGQAPTTVTVTIPDGVAGTLATLKAMSRYIRSFKTNPEIRQFVMTVLRGIPGKRWYAEIHRLFSWVQSNITYRMDVNGVETLHDPIAIIGQEWGDCDDMCILLATMLESAGYSTRFIACGFNVPDEFDHVFMQVLKPDRRTWLSLDPTENHGAGWQPPNIVAWLPYHN